MLSRISQQVQNMTGALNQVTSRANKASAIVGAARSLVTGLEVNQRAEASKLEEICDQLYKLTYMLGRLQHEHQ
jgi:hypothetical protein